MATSLTPIYGSGGLITGYAGSDGKPTSGYQKPIYGSNGLITGYSGGNANYQTGLSASNSGDPSHTFNPTTGLNSQGLTAGQQAAKDYQQNTAPVATTKSQPIANATTDLLNKEQGLSNNLTKSFSDYLNEAKNLQQGSASQVAQDTQTMNNLPGQLSNSLSDIVNQYARTAGNLVGQVTDINAANRERVTGNIANANTLNDKQSALYQQDIASLSDMNKQYEDAARNVGLNAVNAAQARANASRSATGTPIGEGGYWNREAASIYSQNMLPVEQQIAQNRISELTNYITPLQGQDYSNKMGTLTNYATPQEQSLYANDIAKVTGLEMPIAQSLVQYGITNANQVAQLQANLVGRSLNEQTQYLSSLGMPIQLAMQVAQSLPGSLGQLSNIDQQNTWYNLAQNYSSPLNGALPTYNPAMPSGGSSGGYGGGGGAYSAPAGFNYGGGFSMNTTPYGGTTGTNSSNANTAGLAKTTPVTPATASPGYYYGNNDSWYNTGQDFSTAKEYYYQNLYNNGN